MYICEGEVDFGDSAGKEEEMKWRRRWDTSCTFLVPETLLLSGQVPQEMDSEIFL